MDSFGKETKFSKEVEEAFHEFCEENNYHGRFYTYEQTYIKEALSHCIGDKNVQDSKEVKAK